MEKDQYYMNLALQEAKKGRFQTWKNPLVGAVIFKELKIKEINLLTNNPDKIDQLNDYGIKINKRIPLELASNAVDRFYLQTKKKRFHHLLELKEAE